MKGKTESEMRKTVMHMAKLLGCVPEVQAIFSKYDVMLKQATDPMEKYQIGLSGVKELHTLMGMRGALIVNDQIIIPQDKMFDPTKYKVV